MADPTALLASLQERAGGVCELCGADSGLSAHAVPHGADDGPDRAVLVCETCGPQLRGEVALAPQHWFCLQGAIWSEVPAVQVLSWRTLQGLRGETWAQDLLEQAYLDEETQAWAEAGLESAADAAPATVDCNGTPLADGDSVTLIKDLDVKGANFTAKRGTLVKNIRLSEDPGLVEGRVNKVGIYLKTEFIKKSS